MKFGLIVGNKDDNPEKKIVCTEDAQRFADQVGIKLFETSAKDNKNVDEVISLLLPWSSWHISYFIN